MDSTPRLPVALLFIAFLTVAFAQQSALTSLGIQESGAQKEVVYSLSEGRVPVYQAAKAFKSLDASLKAKAVVGALAWAKTYTSSPAFLADYEKQRQSAKPSAPSASASVDKEMARQRAERRKSLDEMKQNVAKMSPDMQRQMAATIKQMEESFAKMDSDPQMVAMMRQGIERNQAEEQKRYQDALAAYNKKWPADPKQLIVQRLQQFLDISKDVDYNAQLFDDRGKKKFVDSKYQSKPDNWKLCFRAGKETTDAARAFAASWLKELQK